MSGTVHGECVPKDLVGVVRALFTGFCMRLDPIGRSRCQTSSYCRPCARAHTAPHRLVVRKLQKSSPELRTSIAASSAAFLPPMQTKCGLQPNVTTSFPSTYLRPASKISGSSLWLPFACRVFSAYSRRRIGWGGRLFLHVLEDARRSARRGGDAANHRH